MITKPFTIRYELKSKKDYENLLWMLRGALGVDRKDGNTLNWITDEANNTVIIDTTDTWFKTNLIIFFGVGDVIYSKD